MGKFDQAPVFSSKIVDKEVKEAGKDVIKKIEEETTETRDYSAQNDLKQSYLDDLNRGR